MQNAILFTCIKRLLVLKTYFGDFFGVVALDRFYCILQKNGSFGAVLFWFIVFVSVIKVQNSPLIMLCLGSIGK